MIYFALCVVILLNNILFVWYINRERERQVKNVDNILDRCNFKPTEDYVALLNFKKTEEELKSSRLKETAKKEKRNNYEGLV